MLRRVDGPQHSGRDGQLAATLWKSGDLAFTGVVICSSPVPVICSSPKPFLTESIY
jgi:hypothetical protein